jgi:hypothetical protein
LVESAHAPLLMVPIVTVLATTLLFPASEKQRQILCFAHFEYISFASHRFCISLHAASPQTLKPAPYQGHTQSRIHFHVCVVITCTIHCKSSSDPHSHRYTPDFTSAAITPRTCAAMHRMLTSRYELPLSLPLMLIVLVTVLLMFLMTVVCALDTKGPDVRSPTRKITTAGCTRAIGRPVQHGIC